MPHRAMMLMQVNGRTTDPEFLAGIREQIASATSIVDLVHAVGLGDNQQVVDAAGAADGHLPSAVTTAILGAYRAAAESGTDGVQVGWELSGGFSVRVAHAPGTANANDGGFINVTVRSPRIG